MGVMTAVFTVTTKLRRSPPYCITTVKVSSTSLSMPRLDLRNPVTDTGRPNRHRAWSMVWVPLTKYRQLGIARACGEQRKVWKDATRLTQSKRHALARTVLLACPTRYPTWRRKVEVYLRIADVAQGARINQVLQGAKVAVESPVF